jgi:hypothetical protein
MDAPDSCSTKNHGPRHTIDAILGLSRAHAEAGSAAARASAGVSLALHHLVATSTASALLGSPYAAGMVVRRDLAGHESSGEYNYRFFRPSCKLFGVCKINC